MKRFGFLAVAVVALAGFASTGVAQAASIDDLTWVGNDPKGDAPPKADILGFGASHGKRITLGMQLRHATDPTNHHWGASGTAAVWSISTDTDHIQLVLLVDLGAGAIVGLVLPGLDPTAPPVCTEPAKFVPGGPHDNLYQVKVPRSCVGDPSEIRVGAGMNYDRKPFGPPGPEDFVDSTEIGPAVAFEK
jgi:hypothetical protein